MFFISYLIHLCFAYATAEPMMGQNVSPANFREFPFIVSLGIKAYITPPRRTHFCTGSLIAKKHVLTAAHCLVDHSYHEVDVIVGDTDLTTATITYDVESWITYNDWANERNRTIRFAANDLSIVKLTTTVYRIGIEPVTFTNLKAEQLQRKRGVIVGWGYTVGGVVTNVLLKGPVMTLTHEECEYKVKVASGRPLTVPKNYLCTWRDPYVTAGCGDSGGPLLDENNHLMGVIRMTCPNPEQVNFPAEDVNRYLVDVHTDVSFYMDFFKDVANIRVATKCVH